MRRKKNIHYILTAFKNSILGCLFVTLSRNSECKLSLTPHLAFRIPCLSSPLALLFIFCLFFSVTIHTQFIYASEQYQEPKNVTSKEGETAETTPPNSSAPFSQQKLPLTVGRTALANAQKQIASANESLNKILTVEMLQSILGMGEMPVSEFLDKLLKESGATILRNRVDAIKNDYAQAGEHLKTTLQNFQQATFGFQVADAHLKLADTYLLMNRDKEAIQAYQNCRKSGFENLTVPIDEFRRITHQIAILFAKEKTPIGEENPGIAIIHDFIKFADNSYSKQKNNFGGALEDTPDAERAIISNMMLNKFELVRFYINTFRKDDARREYDNRYAEVKEQLAQYPDAQIRIEELNAAVDDIKDNVDVTFTFISEEFDRKTKKTNSFFIEAEEPILTEAKLYLIPYKPKPSDDSVQLPDARIPNSVKYTSVSADAQKPDLANCYIIFYQGKQNIAYIKLANEFLITERQRSVRHMIPVGEYTSVISILNLTITYESCIPFKIYQESSTGKKSIMPSPYADSIMALIGVETPVHSADAQIAQKPGLKSQPKFFKVPCSGSNFTIDNCVRNRIIPPGNYGVKINQEFPWLLSKEWYIFSVAPVQHTPKRQMPLWIPAIIGAVGISILIF